MMATTSADGSPVGSVKLSTSLWETSLEMPNPQLPDTVNPLDKDTPDDWVNRHPAMVRLTGRHPFNSEPPLAKLQEAGWVTPASLHVVRNHGAVPKLNWDTHRLKVTGVPEPRELTMDEIASGAVGEVVSFPVSFICAGNRRKEQNMVKKTVGFNWGPAAVANSVWTGVHVCDILHAFGITKPSKEHRFVHFEGPEGELPQGATGSYGTSIDIGWALDRERDVLLAFKQNGEPLTPDHGAPLRTLLPGCIGGRMIKWLCSMHVSDKPSENHYHYFDNRVLPPHVDAELATKEGWWYKPDYIINHQNINSAMFEPGHNSVFRLEESKTLKVTGYAYTGGGSMIIRAEISLDSGLTWELTELNRPEDAIAAARATDKHWCWAWWETEVEVKRIKGCSEIMCRAWDSNQNCQPLFLTWNVMGMLNNPTFRIRVHPHDDDGHAAVWFEHPTQPGNETGGWMTEDAGKFDPSKATRAANGPGHPPKRPVAGAWNYQQTFQAAADAGSKPAAAAAAAVVAGNREAGKAVSSNAQWLQGVALEEAPAGQTWIAVKGNVYDCTPYMEAHPGGASSILLLAGQEATEDFEAVHSSKAWDLLEDYYIGPLKGSASASASAPAAVPAAAPAAVAEEEVFLNPKQVKQLPLVERIEVSQDTRIFRFGLPTPTTRLGLPTGMHMFLRARINGELVMRPYTPMTDDSTVGHVDFLIKVYRAGEHPQFPDGGKMSQHLDSMKLGDTIDVKGPLGEFIYKGRGHFTYNGKPHQCKQINMIAGGTGLTPCWQVANAVLRDPEDTTQVRLIYANRTPQDILAREQLDQMAQTKPHWLFNFWQNPRFELWYTVDRLPESESGWAFDVGFISEKMLQEHLFQPGEDTVTLMCGPPVMIEKACKPNLAKLGHSEHSLFVF